MAWRFLVVSGCSNAGKTEFCRWLSANEGFVHVEADRNGIDTSGLRSAWGSLEAGSVEGLKAAVLQSPRELVLDWAFPPNNHTLRLVKQLQQAGFEAWFFDADEAQARASFKKRGEGLIEDFEALAAGINAWRAELEGLYAHRWLQTLDPNGRRISPEEIARCIGIPKQSPRSVQP